MMIEYKIKLFIYSQINILIYRRQDKELLARQFRGKGHARRTGRTYLWGCQLDK